MQLVSLQRSVTGTLQPPPRLLFSLIPSKRILAADLQEQEAESATEAVGLPVPLADGSTVQISRASGSQRPLFVLDALEQQLLPEPGHLALDSQPLHPELLSRCLPWLRSVRHVQVVFCQHVLSAPRSPVAFRGAVDMQVGLLSLILHQCLRSG